MKQRRCTDGFTLIEVLVAIAIFGVMSVFAYQGMRNFLHGRAVLDAHGEEFAALLSGTMTLQQDFAEAAARPVRDALGEPVPALEGDAQDRKKIVALTRHTAWTQLQAGQSDLRRVEYRLEDGALLRRAWQVLDRLPNSSYEDRVVLSDVAAVEFRYFAEGEWHTEWPADRNAESLSTLPSAVELNVRFQSGRALVRQFRLGSG